MNVLEGKSMTFLYGITGSLLLQKLMKYTNFNNFLHAMLIILTKIDLNYAFFPVLIYNLIKLEKNELFCFLTPPRQTQSLITYYNDYHTCMHAHIHPSEK